MSPPLASTHHAAPSRTTPLLVAAATLALVAMLAGYAPTPLYPLYREQWGLSETDVSLVFAGYPVGVIGVLLGLGGLSDVIGRRATMLIGLGVMVTAMAVLAGATGLTMLVAGRLLHGAAAGLITASAAAALMQFHPRGAGAGSFVNAFVVSFGVAFGPFFAGALAELFPRPTLTPYVVIAALAVVPLVALSISREAVERQAAPLVRRLRVPRAILGRFSLAAGALVVTNILFGMVGAFGPEVAHAIGWRSEAAVGFLVALPLGMVTLAQFAGRGLGHLVALRLGSPLAAIGWGIVALGTSSSHPAPVLLGLVLLGGGAGLNLFGAATLIGVIAPAERQAEIYASWLVVGFTTLATSALIAGPLVAASPLPAVLLGCGVVTALIAVGLSLGGCRLNR